MTRPHGTHVKLDPNFPVHTAACMRCGDLYNREELRAQYEWAGLTLIDTGFKVCPRCLDKPQPQLKSKILPPDPYPIYDALPISFSLDMVSNWTIQPVIPGANMYSLYTYMSGNGHYTAQLNPSYSLSTLMNSNGHYTAQIANDYSLSTAMNSNGQYTAQIANNYSLSTAMNSNGQYTAQIANNYSLSTAMTGNWNYTVQISNDYSLSTSMTGAGKWR